VGNITTPKEAICKQHGKKKKALSTSSKQTWPTAWTAIDVSGLVLSRPLAFMRGRLTSWTRCVYNAGLVSTNVLNMPN
jgi:hypothetical protein